MKLWLGRVDGEGNIPKNMAFIVAANHASYYDTLLIPSVIVQNTNKRVHALINNDYWKSSFSRFFLNMWQCIPVFVKKEKNSKEKNRIAIKKAIAYIKNGHIMMIFPEGTRSWDGKLKKAYTGIARLALKSKAPVLPIGITNSNKVLPKGKIFPRFARCRVKIGKLMYFDEYYDKKITNKIMVKVTRTIMRKIASLCNQKYNY